jgi:hypothetical protein
MTTQHISKLSTDLTHSCGVTAHLIGNGRWIVRSDNTSTTNKRIARDMGLSYADDATRAVELWLAAQPILDGYVVTVGIYVKPRLYVFGVQHRDELEGSNDA